MRDHGGQHTGQMDILSEDGTAIGLRRTVPARRFQGSDQGEVGRILQVNLFRHRQLGGGLNQFAKTGGPTRARMMDDA